MTEDLLVIHKSFDMPRLEDDFDKTARWLGIDSIILGQYWD